MVEPSAEAPAAEPVALDISPLFSARQQLHDHWREGEMERVSASKLKVPHVLRVKWAQNAATVGAEDLVYVEIYGIPGVDFEVEHVSWEDVGLIKVRGKDWAHNLTLPLLRPIITDRCQWWVGESKGGSTSDAVKKAQNSVLKMELVKADAGLEAWDRLTTGGRLTNIIYDANVLPGSGNKEEHEHEQDAEGSFNR